MTEKGKARLERVASMRAAALELIARKGSWKRLNRGPEVLSYEDDAFLIMFCVTEPIPIELRQRFNLGPLHCGL